MPAKPRRRKFALLFTALVMAVGIGILFWRMIPRHPFLLRNAQRVLTARQTLNFPYGGPTQLTNVTDTPYAWESDRALFWVQMKVFPNDGVANSAERSETDRSGSTLVTDLPGQSAEWVRSVNSMASGYAAEPNGPAFYHSDTAFAVSPNGKWTLWYADPQASMTRSNSLAVSRDGFINDWNMDGLPIGHAVWLPDSRHWLELRSIANHIRLLKHDVNDANVSQDTILPPNADDDLLGITADNRLLTVSYLTLQARNAGGRNGMGWGPVASFTTRTLEPPFRVVQQSSLITPGPNSGYVLDVALSPQGDRLAWIVTADDMAHASTFVKAMMRLFGSRERTQQAVWTTKLDGSDAREIGCLDFPDEKERIDDLRWVPGGKRLSFRYKDGLYTVPVE